MSRPEGHAGSPRESRSALAAGTAGPARPLPPLPCLPAHGSNVVAFLAGCPVPTAEAPVAKTMAGIRRNATDGGETAAKKLAATVALLHEILQPIPEDLRGLRDLTLLLVGSAGARRRLRQPRPRRGHPSRLLFRLARLRGPVLFARTRATGRQPRHRRHVHRLPR